MGKDARIAQAKTHSSYLQTSKEMETTSSNNYSVVFLSTHQMPDIILGAAESKISKTWSFFRKVEILHKQVIPIQIKPGAGCHEDALGE